MERQYFDNYTSARTEYDRLVRFGRPAYLYCD